MPWSMFSKFKERIPVPSSIRNKLVGIVAASLLPSLLLSIIVGFELSASINLVMDGEITRAAESLANQYKTIITFSEQMLRTIRVTEAVRSKSIPEMEALFKHLLNDNPNYATILAVDNTGWVLASASESKEYSLADRAYIQEALHTGNFSVGSYIISRSTGEPIIPISYPITDTNGNIQLILIGALGTAYIQEQLSIFSYPEASIFEIIDRDGIRVFRYPYCADFSIGEYRDAELWASPLFERNATASFVYDYKGERYLKFEQDINFGTAKEPAFRAILALPLSYRNFKTSTSPIRLIIMSLVSIGFSMLLASWLYRHYIGLRFMILLDQAARLGDEEYGQIRPSLDGEDELDMLRRTLSDSTEHLYQKEKEQKEAAAAIKASLKEKEVLLREVHHRVKNNFQVISSLLSIQIMALSDEETIQIFEESRNRIQSMAIIHERLYRSENFSYIDFCDYTHSLAEQIAATYWDENQHISYVLEAADSPLDLDTAVPLGLIMNEVLSNAYKHAFFGRKTGEIHIQLKGIGRHNAYVKVRDNGHGLPADFDERKKRSLGMTLIHTLTEQIHGELSIQSPIPETACGTSFTICFPLPEAFTWTEKTELKPINS